jgi:MFS family permease
MSEQDYLNDISEIKDLMNRSSRFISLSGLSGIFAGIYALIGAAVAYWLVANSGREYLILDGYVFRLIVLDLFLIAFFSVVTAIYLTTRKARKNGEKVWDASSRRLIINFLIPLIAGGIYILIILNQQKYGQTAALMLIFYGLALINASKYSIGHVRYLGFTEIVLGLICAIFPGYGFWLWVIGFGIMHILYGSIMFVQEKRT